MLFALVPPMVIADLGAGEGTLAQLLAKRARKVIAVDNSEKMVEFGADARAQTRLRQSRVPPRRHRGAAHRRRLASISRILSQALHHAASPARAVAAAHKLLKRGGRLAILDLQAHQFEQARELYADTWLGFTEAQMLEFLEGAGFREIEIGVVSRDEVNPQFQTDAGDRGEVNAAPRTPCGPSRSVASRWSASPMGGTARRELSIACLLLASSAPFTALVRLRWWAWVFVFLWGGGSLRRVFEVLFARVLTRQRLGQG